jgi:hypothetical protein
VDPTFVAPVVLRAAHGPVARLVFNEAGVPRSIEVSAEPRDAAAPAAPASKSSLPACAAAADVLFCPDASGAVHAWRGEHHAVVAHARAGTDVAAASLAGHAVLAYVAERVTTEGIVREAWAVVDESPPVRLSEEGSGATFVDLAPRGTGLLAMIVDARAAMTPAHARPLTFEGGALKLGRDAVVFVGGSAERHNSGALLTTAAGGAFELVAVADGADSFGMAAIAIDDPPREDEPVTWSLYPNGLDPAPLAATQGETRPLVVRVRPHDPAPKAFRVLELGELGAGGTFSPLCILDQAPFIKDVEIAPDLHGGLWVFYRDPRGSVLERRALPSPVPPSPVKGDH